jgi:hypothetical protein
MSIEAEKMSRMILLSLEIHNFFLIYFTICVDNDIEPISLITISCRRNRQGLND